MTPSVAVIGAGPSGLVAARWLSSQGFEPTIFEQGPMLGGQWAGQDGHSGVWPRMYTNSSRTLTAFSDLEHESSHVYLSNREVLDYLHRYANSFKLTSRIRFGTRVDMLCREGTAWVVIHDGTHERFDRVVVASGRFHAPPRFPRCRGWKPSPAQQARSPRMSTATVPLIGTSAFWSRAVRSARSRLLRR